MSTKYYFDLPYTRKYDTIWYGYLEFDRISDDFNVSLLNDILVEITDINFYINI